MESLADKLGGISISGQATYIQQTSSLNLQTGDLKDSDGADIGNLSPYHHKSSVGSFSVDLNLQKNLSEDHFFLINFEFANGVGVDSSLQGGAMVNNDIMEDINNHDTFYLAKAYYQGTYSLGGNYKFTLNVGQVGVIDFFDIGPENEDQTTQFLNQAIANNGAFDYVQDLEGHGYTPGIVGRVACKKVGATLGFFSSDSYLDNIKDKYSLVFGIDWTPTFMKDLGGYYQIFFFHNEGEYGSFTDDGVFVTANSSAINTQSNADTLSKNGFGFTMTQALSDRINIFGKYGKQRDDRDVRHYQDMDETFMLGGNITGLFSVRKKDVLGLAYQHGRLTGNHQKAHEKGYEGFFDRSGGVGVGNYGDEGVLEVYYRFVFANNTSLSFNLQHVSNFYYSKKIGAVDFFAARLNVFF